MKRILAGLILLIPLLASSIDADAQKNGPLSEPPMLTTVNKITVPTSATATVIFEDTNLNYKVVSGTVVRTNTVLFTAKKNDVLPFYYGFTGGYFQILLNSGNMLIWKKFSGVKVIGDGTTVIGPYGNAAANAVVDSLRSAWLRANLRRQNNE